MMISLFTWWKKNIAFFYSIIYLMRSLIDKKIRIVIPTGAGIIVALKSIIIDVIQYNKMYVALYFLNRNFVPAV